MIVKRILGLALFAVGLAAAAEPINLYTTSVYRDSLDILSFGAALGSVVMFRGLVEPLQPVLGGLPMPVSYVVAGVAALALLVYLVVALLKPEVFS
jgi:K+-transporting ATPase KdpF subunit